MASLIYYLDDDSDYVQDDKDLDISNLSEEDLEEDWERVEITWEKVKLKTIENALTDSDQKDLRITLGLEDCPRRIKPGDIVYKRDESFIFYQDRWIKIESLSD
jgi:hypothetical protein